MHDLLVRYLLGEVSDEEQRSVEEALARDAKLRLKLEHLRHCFQIEDETVPSDAPPEGLAERTIARLTDLEESTTVGTPTGGEVDRYRYSSLGFTPVDGDDQWGGVSQWSVVDMIVAAGVVLAVGMLLLPALRESRSAARRAECQNHMWQLGLALTQYADNNHGYFPVVNKDESAGIFAVRLAGGGYIDRDRIAKLLVCPSAPLADELAAGHILITVPSEAELRSLHGTRRFFIQRLMGGNYAYQFGYLDPQGRYRAVRNEYKSDLPVLADAPSIQQGEFRSCNHGGCGQNVLFQGQEIKYVKGYLTPDGTDHLFLNAAGVHAAGHYRRDFVLGRSEATPKVFSIERTP